MLLMPSMLPERGLLRAAILSCYREELQGYPSSLISDTKSMFVYKTNIVNKSDITMLGNHLGPELTGGEWEGSG